MTEEKKEEKGPEEIPVPEIKAVRIEELNLTIKLVDLKRLATGQWLDLEEQEGFGPQSFEGDTKPSVAVMFKIALLGLQKFDKRIEEKHVRELDLEDVMAITVEVLSKKRRPDFTGQSTP